MRYTNNRFCAVLTARFWGAVAVLLCALLSQSCQLQLSVLEEESPAEVPSQSGCQPPASEALMQPLGYPPSLTRATHQPKVILTAFSGTLPCTGIRPTASTTRSRNGLIQDSSRPLTASTGELIRFQQVGSQWQAVVQEGIGTMTHKRTLSVVSSCDIGTQLASWQRQDVWASRSRIHIMATSSPPYAPCVYLGKCGLLGGMPTQQVPLAAAVARANTERDEAVARASEVVTNANTARDAAVARANEAVVRANTERDEAVARANTARDAALARENEAVVRANKARDKAVAWANEAVVRANKARDKAVAWAKKAESMARDQEIAPTRNSLAAALRTKTFGKAEWKQYFGDVGSAPDLPSNMATILDGPCPFWPNKKVRDTHLLVLIPATVGGVPFTLNLLGELIKRPSNGGHRTEYSYYNERVQAQIGKESPPCPYWLLMTRDVLPGSRNTGYADQKALVANYASRESVPYALPSVLEATTAILMHHAREGERLFGDHPWTYTRCQEVVDGSNPALVGGFDSSGLFVHSYCYDYNSDGAACCWKF